MLLNKLTIGSSIESLVYAFVNDTYFLPTLAFGPIFYKKMNHPVILDDREDFTWSRIQLSLALTGKLLNYEKINSINISDQQLKISSEAGLFKYRFNTCNIFDPTGIKLDNEIKIEIPATYRVYDDFEISNLGGKHKYLQPKHSRDCLAREINYYCSDRVDGANYVTDCVVESLLSKEQINNVDYSDSMVRFAVSRHLTSIGIHGTLMTVYKNGKPKYRKPKVIHKKRIVIEQENNVYSNSETVRFLKLSVKEILDGARS